MAPKTVCIVGAGPSGLVAAKNLLHHRSFDPGSGSGFSVTMFDAQPRIGGLWPVEKTDGAGLVHPLMVTNQSRHTMQFSDLAWDDSAPQLPRAWQVGRYLQQYLARYCACEGERFRLRLGSKVERAVPRRDGEGRRWLVTARSEDGLVEEAEYDYLVIASGFFGKPAVPEIPGLKEPRGIPVVHSSRYRNLETLLSNGDGKGGKILVVGGQMSGVEIAATIASHLSSAANTSGQSTLSGTDKYTVHHIIQRPVWVFPLHTSPAPGRASAPFMPLDLTSYNLANRPKPLMNSQGHITADSAKMTHSLYQAALGTDQAEFSPLLRPLENDLEDPPYLAVSDWYADFVRSGLVTLSKGKLKALADTTATIAPISPDQEPTAVTEIAAVVLATGFEAAPSLSFLPDEVQRILGLDPSDIDNALLLKFHGTHHPDVPDLGFVGFYRSPYWGVMEMQARFLTELWTKQQQGHLSPSLEKALTEDTSIQRFTALRGDPCASQFPMGDYPFLMQEFAAALDMRILLPAGQTPPLPHNDKPMDIMTPARYASTPLTNAQRAEVQKSRTQAHETAMAGLTQGRFVARAVFRSLLGEWHLERDLVSKLPSHPSGHWSGTAKFLFRQGTNEGLKCVDADTLGGTNGEGENDDSLLEYLYIEEGQFTTTTGLAFPATRRYVWRYNEKTDKLSVWFVRTGDKFPRKDPRRDEEQMKADYLFHEVEFVVPEDYTTQGDHTRGWEAKAGHLCVEDFYDVHYEFRFNAVNLRDWKLEYTVKGPQKDYTIDGTYRRKITGSA